MMCAMHNYLDRADEISQQSQESRLYRNLLVLLILLSLNILSCSHESIKTDIPVGKITHLEGKVEIKRNQIDEPIPADLGMPLFHSDVVWVGDSGRIEILLTTGELLPISANTSLVLKQKRIVEKSTPSLLRKAGQKLLSLFVKRKSREESLTAEGALRREEDLSAASSSTPVKRERKAIIITGGCEWRSEYSGTDPYTVALYHFDELSGTLALMLKEIAHWMVN